MTREQKLALIVGFALVLVVGVLISDQMSVSRRSVDPSTGTGNGLAAALEPEGQFSPGLGRPLETRTETVAQRPTSAPQVLLIGDEPPQSPLGSPVADPAGTSLAQAAMDGLTDGARQVGQLWNDATNGAIPAIKTDPTNAPPSLEMGFDRVETPANQTNEIALQPEPKRETPREPVRAVKTHRVQDNDTLWSIAQKYYGDGNLAAKLAAYNAGRIGKNNVIQPGASLLIPDRAELTGGAAPAKTAETPTKKPEPAKTAKTTETKPEKSKPGESKTYTVQSGDTLQKISQKFFGTTKRWTEILDLNKRAIDDEDNLQIGTVLTIPAR